VYSGHSQRLISYKHNVTQNISTHSTFMISYNIHMYNIAQLMKLDIDFVFVQTMQTVGFHIVHCIPVHYLMTMKQ